MKKDALSAYLILGILILLFCVVAFLIPVAHDDVFWVALIFALIAFLTQILIWKSALGEKEPPKSRFIGIPQVYIGAIYLATQLVAFFVLVFTPQAPLWTAIIACTGVFAISSVLVLLARLGKRKISHFGEYTRKRTDPARTIIAETNLLYESVETSSELKGSYKELRDKARFCDPISSVSSAKMEQQILLRIEELKATKNNQAQLIKEIEKLLDLRNSECRKNNDVEDAENGK